MTMAMSAAQAIAIAVTLTLIISNARDRNHYSASEPLAPPEPEPEQPQPPEPLRTAASEPPAPPTKPALFNGWRRRLEPWEIPPRPAQAPEDASPPVFEGDNWFWFGTGPQIKAERPGSAPERDHGLGPEWDGTPGWDSTKEDDSLRDWPHLVYGVSVPAPGSNESSPGLDPADPLSTEPAVKDTRTHGQKLLDGMISCVKLAARTGQLPLNSGLRTQLIISCTEEDLHRSDGWAPPTPHSAAPCHLACSDSPSATLTSPP